MSNSDQGGGRRRHRAVLAPGSPAADFAERVVGAKLEGGSEIAPSNPRDQTLSPEDLDPAATRLVVMVRHHPKK